MPTKSGPTVPPTRAAKVYYGGPHKVADQFILRQGYQAISFDGERMPVNEEWAERCESIPPGSMYATC
jgi:hypothetical protein